MVDQPLPLLLFWFTTVKNSEGILLLKNEKVTNLSNCLQTLHCEYRDNNLRLDSVVFLLNQISMYVPVAEVEFLEKVF